MIPVILFIIIGIRLEYTDFLYWFYVIIYGIVTLIQEVTK